MSSRAALKFVLMIGVVSFFADFTYEGSRGITGPFLQKLGATGTIVSVAAGFGELFGYGLRFFSGRLCFHLSNQAGHRGSAVSLDSTHIFLAEPGTLPSRARASVVRRTRVGLQPFRALFTAPPTISSASTITGRTS